MKKNAFRLVATSLLFVASSAFAGQWNYNCAFIGDATLTCEQVSLVAKNSVTEEFAKLYPASKYTVVFTVDNMYFNNTGTQVYSATASLHKKGEANPYSSGEFGRSAMGYDGRNPSVALQIQNVKNAITKATTDLVSQATGR